MKIIIVINLYLFICACAGLVYGLAAMYKKKRPLYFKLMIFPIACLTFSRVFYLTTLLCYGKLPDTFNIGFLGFAAFFLFLYLPNVGPIDGLLDESDKGFIKYKLIALIIPVVELAIAVVAYFCCNVTISVRISFVVLSALAGFAGYFNLKHFLVPDVEGGIIRSLRQFNLVCILSEIFTLAEVAFYCFDLQVPKIIAEIFLGILYVVFPLFLNKGTNKWTQ